jgi:uncharacterized protein with GYD domain
MRKCLVQVSYTGEGLKGLLKESATQRREATEQLIASLGGTIEAFHYAFGEDDLFVSADLPDNVTATTSSFVVNVRGVAKAKMIVPLAPKEIGQVTKKTIVYRPVGK